MTLTLSPPVRVFALVGVLAAAGLVAYVFLLGRSQEDRAPATSGTVMRQTTSSTVRAPATPAPMAKPEASAAQGTKSGFPPVVDRALRKHRVVVVAVYAPGAAVDSVVRAEARAGAKRAEVGFLAVSATNERVLGLLVAKTGVLPNPAVLVIKRPGVVTATFTVTDSGTIAQTALQAKR